MVARAERNSHRRPNLAVVLMFGHSDHTSRPLPQGAEFVLKLNVEANLAHSAADEGGLRAIRRIRCCLPMDCDATLAPDDLGVG